LPLPLHTTNFVFSGLVKAHVLVYGQSVLYTWDDPTVEQKLVCSVVEHESTETEIKLNAVSKPYYSVFPICATLDKRNHLCRSP